MVGVLSGFKKKYSHLGGSLVPRWGEEVCNVITFVTRQRWGDFPACLCT